LAIIGQHAMIAQRQHQILGHAQELTLTVPVLLTHVAEKLVSQTVPALAPQEIVVAKMNVYRVYQQMLQLYYHAPEVLTTAPVAPLDVAILVHPDICVMD